MAIPSSQPRVSVIVVNFNGRRHLEACFASLLRLDYAADRLELILVDNGSRDGSGDFMRQRYPQVRLVSSPQNVGFGAGNNLGAEQARGEHLVFLNNDMRVDPQFVRALVSARQSAPDVVCVGAKILNWDGSRIDFAGAAAHFAGYAYQLGYDLPRDRDEFNSPEPILFACGGAMLIDRQIFLDVGGFDADYFALYEDLDLGWRLWLLGHRVVFAPQALVYHHHHGTLDTFANYRKRVLYQRNALYTVVKNYSDENLNGILPAVLLGTVQGVVSQAAGRAPGSSTGFNLASAPLSQFPVRLGRLHAASLLALDQVAENLPQLMDKRRAIQARRRRADAAISPLFRRPFRHWPGVSAQTQYALCAAHGIQDIFADVPRRVLVISSDILPYPGLPTVGSGLRAWGLGQGLKSRGHEVMFSMPRGALKGREGLVPGAIAELAWENHTLGAVVRQADPDVVVVCNWPVLALLPTDDLQVPVILDQHGPHYMEREYQKAGTAADNTWYKLAALRKADFFTCAGAKQLVYFQSWLERAGWSEQERAALAAAIPVSLSPELPERRPHPELSFVYGGVFLPWQDPSAGLTVLVEAIEAHGAGRLYFFGGKHPFYPVDPGLFEPLLARLKQSDRVTAPGMVSHDELIERYTRAHVAIDVMKRNPERELAFTTRTVEYLWCGLPVIYHDYAELSDYIREYEAGWTVDPEDRNALRRVVDDVFDHPEEVARRSQNARRLVRERLTWDRTIEPMDHFIRHPQMRPHVVEPAAGSQLQRRLRQMLRTSWAVYRHQGFSTLWREGWAFLRSRWLFE